VDTHERRNSQRVYIEQPVTMKYNRDGNFEFTCISRDLSASGIFLYTESVLEEGEQVELMLTFHSESSHPIPMQVRGRVIRVERFPVTGIAVQFDNMTVVPETLVRR
jgi:hypothetical protein